MFEDELSAMRPSALRSLLARIDAEIARRGDKGVPSGTALAERNPFKAKVVLPARNIVRTAVAELAKRPEGGVGSTKAPEAARAVPKARRPQAAETPPAASKALKAKLVAPAPSAAVTPPAEPVKQSEAQLEGVARYIHPANRNLAWSGIGAEPEWMRAYLLNGGTRSALEHAALCVATQIRLGARMMQAAHEAAAARRGGTAFTDGK